MSNEQGPHTPRSLNAADAFDMFIWLQGPYGEVADTADFRSLSSFEQWERLRHYVEQIGYLVGKKNVSTLDEVANTSKAKLLQWLEQGRLRNRTAPHDFHEVSRADVSAWERAASALPASSKRPR